MRLSTGLRRHRGAITAVTATIVGVATIATYAITADGYRSRHVDLNDGGIWVTKNSAGLTGRLNKPIGQLDAGFYPPGGAQSSFSLDVVQDGATVLARDAGQGRLYPVDVTLGAPVAAEAVSIPSSFRVQTRGGTVAALDPATGKLWALRVRGGERPSVAALDPTLKPLAVVGASADLAVSASGTVYAVSGTKGALLTLRPTAEGFTAPTETALATTVPEPSLTTVGERPVVLDRSGSRVVVAGRDPIRLTGPGAEAVIQAPGPAADTVWVATPTGLQRVDLATGASRDAFTNVIGPPAVPTVLGSCVHAAWGGGPGTYARSCSGDPVQARPLPGDGKVNTPMFRVNRNQIVLNDLDSGAVWLVDGLPRRVDNWQAVTPPPAQDKTTDKSTNPNQQGVSAQDRPPVAADDVIGARPGRTNVLHVLDNDSDPDGDVLAVRSVRATAGTARLSVAPDGQTVQVSLPDDASGAVSFSYTLDDGRGRVSNASVSVPIRAASADSRPRLREHFTPKTALAASGGHWEAPVLSDWRDDDSDQVVLVSAKASDGTVTATPDGRLLYDAPSAGGVVRLDYVVADAQGARTAGVAKVRVQGDTETSAIAPVAQPDVVRATVGTALRMRPLANDTPGSDPTDPNAELRLAGQVSAPAGLGVLTDADSGVLTLSPRRAGTYRLAYGASFGASTVSRAEIRVDVVASGSADAILAMPDSSVLRGQQAGIVDVLANDFDPSGAVMVVQQAEPADAGDDLEVAIIQGHWLRITSRVAGLGGSHTVHYTVQDGVSPAATGEVTVTQLPRPAENAAPIAADDEAVVRAGDSVNIPVLDNDLDPNGDQVQLTSDGVSVASGAGRARAFGNAVRYAAPMAITSPALIVLDYTVTDPEGARTTGHVSVRVVPSSDAAHDQPPQPEEVETGVVAGDTRTIAIPTTGVDPDGDSVTVIGIDSPPTLGRVLGIGANSVVYQAYPGSTGPDRLTYVVQDRYGLTALGAVRIGVVPAGAPQPPVAVADIVTAAPNATVRVNMLANDFQTPGDEVSVQPLARTNQPAVPGGATLVTDRISVIAPAVAGQAVTVFYGLTDGTGQASVARITVRAKDGYNNPPVARDDNARLPLSGTTATVDVLANDEDPDGPATGLSLVASDDPSVRIAAGRLVVPIAEFPRNVAYTVRDRGGATAIGVVHVPGAAPQRPQARPDVQTIRLAENSTRRVDLNDYVTSPQSRTLRLTTTDRLWASPRPGLSVTAAGTRGLVLKASANYVGPAAITFEVTDADSAGDTARRLVVTVPVQVGPVQPVLRCPSVPLTLVEGGDPLAVDVTTVCHVWTEDAGALDQVKFEAGWGQRVADVSLSQSGTGGRVLGLRAGGAARPGATGSVTVTAAGTSARSTLQLRVIAAPLPSVSPISVDGVQAGSARTIDVRPYVTTRIADPTVAVRAVTQTGGSAARAGASGSTVTVTPGADSHGTMTFTYSVTDVAARPDRAVTGSITLEVLGRPGTPPSPVITGVRSRTAVVAFAAPAANGAPIQYFELRDQSGRTYRCEASPCTVTGLTNAVPYRFSVRARNSVAWGAWSGFSPAKTPDELPQAPTGLQATPRDRSASLAWSPAVTRGSAVQFYEVRTSPGSVVRISGTSTQLRGLTNGTSYTASLRARNRLGYSPFSAAVPFVPFGRPPQMAPPAATTGPGSTAAREHTISVSWSAANGNGRGITAYTVTQYRDGAAAGTQRLGGRTLRTNFTVPTSGSTYRYTVSATNAEALTSPPSGQSAPPLDVSTVPDQMAAPSATATGVTGQARVTFSSPSANGAAIDGYEVRDSGGGTHSCSGSPCTVAGLSDGTSYSFTVRAHNRNGWGTDSGPSAAITPYGPPAAPNAGARSNGSQTSPAITFSWSGGGGNGRPIKRYETRIDSGGWQNRGPGAGSETRTYGNSETHKICVQVVNSAGQTSSPPTCASARTADKPPPTPPSAAVSHGRSAQGAVDGQGNRCLSTKCYYIHITLRNFPKNVTATCSISASQNDGGWADRGVPTNDSGDYDGDTTAFYGYDGTVTVRCRANGVDESGSIKWT